MKRLLILGALLAGALAGTPMPAALAQDSRAPAALQKEYDGFIAEFRAAMKANDASAVTKLTKFPFYWNEMRDAAYFEKSIYAKVFTSKTRRCLANAKGVYARDPTGSDTFTHFCGEQLFLFAKTPQGFRFSEVGVND